MTSASRSRQPSGELTTHVDFTGALPVAVTGEYRVTISLEAGASLVPNGDGTVTVRGRLAGVARFEGIRE